MTIPPAPVPTIRKEAPPLPPKALPKVAPKRKFEEISSDDEEQTPPTQKKLEGFQSAKDLLKGGSKKNSTTPETEKEVKKGERKPFVSPLIKKVDEEEKEVKEPPAKKQKTGDKKKDISHLFADGNVPEELEAYDPALVETIFNEIMHKDVKVKWDDVIGLEHAKGAVQEAVIWPLQRPEIFKGIRSAPKGLLLFGPPGMYICFFHNHLSTRYW